MELDVERMTEEERKAAADQLRRALGPVGRSLTELQNLSHSASFHPKDRIAPSKRGIEHLKHLDDGARQRVFLRISAPSATIG
jgi:hypothetical protein